MDQLQIPSDLPQDVTSFGQLGPYFDLTLRFEHIVFDLIPSCLFIFCVPYYVFRIFGSPKLSVAGKLFWFKILTGLALLAWEIVLLCLLCSKARFRTDVGIAAGVTSSLAAVCIVVAIFAEHFYSVRPSLLLSFYLALTWILDVFKTYSVFHRGLVTEGIFLSLVLVTKAVLILLEEVPKRGLFISKDLQDKTGKEAISGFWTRTLYLWLNATFVRGYRAILSTEDLDKLDPDLKAKAVYERFQQRWDRANSKKRTCFLRALLGTAGALQITIAILACLLAVASSYAQPFLIKEIVTAVENGDTHWLVKLGLVAACALAYSAYAICRAINQQAVARSAATFRTCSISAIFGKMMVLDSGTLRQGAALTLITSDVTGMQSFPTRANNALAAFASIVGGLIYLALHVKQTAAVVMIPVLICTAFSYLLSAKIKAAQMNWNSKTGVRVASIQGLLSHFKSIRMSGLGKAFSDFVNGNLAGEIDASKNYRFYNSVLFGIDLTGIAITPVAVLLTTYYWTNPEGLPIADVYALLAVSGLIAEPLGRFIHAFSHLAKVMACHDRIRDFLLHEELVDVREDVEAEDANEKQQTSKGKQVATEKAALPDSEDELAAAALKKLGTCPTKKGDQVLQDMEATIRPSKFTVITGPVNSGKSTILRLLLGEVAIAEGQIQVDTDIIGYCGQIPWLQSQSARDNIIGPTPMVDAWYRTVTEACGLDVDFENWPDGDNTKIGQSGSNISGGQKQRIALARAVYSRKPLLLLDDVFSGLDDHTAARIFNSLLGKEGILRQSRTTVVLATSSVEYFSSADYILRLDNRSVVTEINSEPTYDEVSEIGIAPINPEKNGEPSQPASQRSPSVKSHKSHQSSRSIGSKKNKKTKKTKSKKTKKPTRKPKVKEPEDRSTRYYYFSSFGPTQMIFWMLSSAIGELLFKLPNVFIRIWFGSHELDDRRFLIGYTSISVVAVLWGMAYIWWFLTKLIAKSYAYLHGALLDTLLSASYRFIATTESGVILNIFSQDISLGSQELPYSLLHTIMCIFVILSDLGIIASGADYAAVAIPIFLSFLMILLIFYLRTSRQVRLLQLKAMAPIYNLLTEAASGMEHIRAFKWQPFFLTQFIEKLDDAQVPYYQLLCVQQWLFLVLDSGVCGLAIVVAVLGLFLPHQSSANGIGLSLLNLITFSQAISATLRAWAETETSLSAVTRIQEFARVTPQEPRPGDGDANRLWPTKGAIQFDKLSMRFDPENPKSPRIVGGVTFTAQPGQRIGIVGRTGSGKSSLIMAALKMMQYEGSIKVDGVELRQISGDTLRSRITTIGQESVILPGSIRYNLHPYASADNVVTDDAMIGILGKVGLWEHLELHDGLDASVASLQLSEGQQQLLNIARGMLHHIHQKTKIVFMDEVSSQLDKDTDDRVQEAINEVFETCTMLVIAHRRETLQEMDAILTVADGGVSLVPQTRKSNQPDEEIADIDDAQSPIDGDSFRGRELSIRDIALEATERRSQSLETVKRSPPGAGGNGEGPSQPDAAKKAAEPVVQRSPEEEAEYQRFQTLLSQEVDNDAGGELLLNVVYDPELEAEREATANLPFDEDGNFTG